MLLIGDGLSLLSLVFWALSIVGLWRLFEKAGKPGWAALVPFYNLMVLLELLDHSAWWLLLLLLPLVGLIAWLILCADLAAAFGRGTWYAVGLCFVPGVFLPLLGLDGSHYRRPLRASVGRIEF